MNFKFLEVTSDDMLEKIFAFRYKIISEIYPDYFEISCITETIEHDKYDPFSIHFAALNENNEICATVRLIHNSPVGYPTENSMHFNNSMFERDKLGEMSRIFVDSRCRSMKTTKIIIEEVKKFMYVKMMQLGIEYTYGSLEASFLRLLRIYNMNYETIGEEQIHQYVGLRYPSILYTKKLGLDNPSYIKILEATVEK